MSKRCRPKPSAPPRALWLVYSPTHRGDVLCSSDVRDTREEAEALASKRNNGGRLRETDWQVVRYKLPSGWRPE